MSASLPTTDAARLHWRTQTRAVLNQPRTAGVHLARVAAACLLEGAEPVQGALADMFSALDAIDAPAKRAAYLTAKSRLPERIALLFDGLIAQPRIATVNMLATRWSLICIPTADIPTRARRCSPDDSRALANEGIAAFECADQAAQQRFLDHRMTCHDKLAFMLARRAILKVLARLPTPWETVGTYLESLP